MKKESEIVRERERKKERERESETERERDRGRERGAYKKRTAALFKNWLILPMNLFYIFTTAHYVYDDFALKL